MASDTLATLLTKAGRNPQRFNKREARLAKIISDGLSPHTLITTEGDIIIGDSDGDAERLAKGAADTVLVAGADTVAYAKIANANVDAAAAIDFSKLATLTSGNLLVGSAGNVATSVALSGDATLAASGALTVASSAITSAKISSTDGATKVQRVSVGFAALNTAGTGVAALFGTAIPDNAVIRQVYFDVTDSFSGDGDSASTLQLGIEDQDDDTKAAAALSTYALGIVAGIQTGAAANMTKLTAARQLAVTWTAGGTDTALDAGAMEVFIEYVEST